ncbi:hypothetical protein ONZ45_g12710 [Pleurotus djamor]|nr:hypothetical protein ONZ45_g12710 [Pleurotus djamor]
MVIAWNFERIVHAAYEWLSENYKLGDRIYLFGFSRGAYQVRVIAGMIHKVGLLHKGNKNQIPFAYELYASITERTKRESEVKTSDASFANNTEAPSDTHTQFLDADIERDNKLCSQFKATLCRKDVKVHFVGAWDTVSSIGIFRGKSLPETVSGMGHVCAFRHALALDERHVKFQPEYANGGLGPERGDRGDVKEVWFAGSHSDIGGGNVSNENLANFGPALRWMTYEAMTHRLRMHPYEGKWTTVVSKPSLTRIWNLLELLPFPCLSYEGRDTLTFSSQIIDPSNGVDITDQMPGSFSTCLESLSTSCSPSGSCFPSTILPNAIGQKYAWDVLFKTYRSDSIVEKDPFEDVSHTLDTLENICNTLEHRLQAEDEEDPVDFNPFIAAILTLRSFLDDPSRLLSLTEVPHAATILLSALKLAHENRHSDVETRTITLRLLVHARAIELGARRKYQTLQIQEWVKSFGDEFSSLPTKFGDPCLKSQPLDALALSVRFSADRPTCAVVASVDSFENGVTHISNWDTERNQPPQPQVTLPGLRCFISKDCSLAAVISQGHVRVVDLANVEMPPESSPIVLPSPSKALI